jgi:hypothetical protein
MKIYHHTSLVFFLLAVTALFCSCEKVSIDDTGNGTHEQGDNKSITFRITQFEQTAFNDPTSVSRSANVKEVCTRINFGVYDTENKQIKKVNQQVDDKDFGTIKLNLPEGEYHIVALAHSCSGNATYTDPCKITFPDNKVSDTFYYYGDLKISKDETVNLTLKRAVSMFRLKIEDAIPAPVTEIRLYYTGGSSTLNAVTGYGCVNSKQTEMRKITSHEAGQTFETYTFLHSDSGNLKMTVTAYDANVSVIKENVFDAVPMKRNSITQYSGNFFTGIGDTSYAYSYGFNVDNEWTDTEQYSY